MVLYNIDCGVKIAIAGILSMPQELAVKIPSVVPLKITLILGKSTQVIIQGLALQEFA